MEVDPAFVYPGVLCLLLAVAFLVVGRSEAARARRIEGMPATPVRDVVAGVVEVKGRAKGGGPLLTGPLSRKPCVYYRVKVERPDRDGHWRTVVDEVRDCGLLVEDASQAAIPVNIRAAEVRLREDAHARSGLGNDAGAGLEEFLRRHGTSSEGLIFNKTLRYSETSIEPGDELYVLGTARSEGGKVTIDRGGAGDLFLVSDHSKRELASSHHTRKLLGYLAGAHLAVGGLVLVGLGTTFR